MYSRYLDLLLGGLMRAKRYRPDTLSGHSHGKLPRVGDPAADRRVRVEEELLDRMRVALREVERREPLHRPDEGGGAGARTFTERLEREAVRGVLDVAGPAVRHRQRGQ